MTGMDEARFMEDGREPAVRQVKMDLAIAAIIKAENLDVTDEEIEEKYKSMAEQYGMELDMLKKYLDAPTVRNQLLNEKAIAVSLTAPRRRSPPRPKRPRARKRRSLPRRQRRRPPRAKRKRSPPPRRRPRRLPRARKRRSPPRRLRRRPPRRLNEPKTRYTSAEKSKQA